MEHKSIKTYSKDELAELLGPAETVKLGYGVMPRTPKCIKTYGKDQVAEMLGPAETQYGPGRIYPYTSSFPNQ